MGECSDRPPFEPLEHLDLLLLFIREVLMPASIELLRYALDDPRAAHAAPDAHGHEAVALLAATKLVEDGDGQLRARATERMTERDGAAVDVDPLARQRAFAHHGERLTSEGFVEFDQVEV